MDKYLLNILFLNVLTYNKLSKCGRMAGFGTLDSRRDLRLSRLNSLRMDLLQQTSLGRFMMRVMKWARIGAGPIE